MALIRRVYLKNVGVFSEAEVMLEGGLTVVTGETGAGKSTFAEALSAVTGQRWPIRSGKGTAVVEVEVEAPPEVLRRLESEGIEPVNPLIIRRQRTVGGRSRAFVNDEPVPSSLLQEIASELIDVHSQHQSLLLRRPYFHLQVVDAFARSGPYLERYLTCYRSYRHLRKEIQLLQGEAKEDIDYIRFLKEELDTVAFSAAEFDQLEDQLRRAEHAEQIVEAVSAAIHLLDAEGSATEQINQAIDYIKEVVRYDDRLGELEEILRTSVATMREVVWRLQERITEVDYTPEEIRRWESERDRIYRLMLKHNVQTFEELLRQKEIIARRFEALSHRQQRLAELQAQLGRVKKKLTAAAAELSAHRRRHLDDLANTLQQMAARLMMPKACIQLEIVPIKEWTPYGADRVRFLFSANPGIAPAPVESVASGGEISRLMLAIKWVLTREGRGPALILDEIDAGISGEAARKVAELIAEMAHGRQVVVISHAPQTAALPGQHIHVEKQHHEGQTMGRFRVLSETERVKAIAQLIAGSRQTEATLSVARQLLDHLSSL